MVVSVLLEVVESLVELVVDELVVDELVEGSVVLVVVVVVVRLARAVVLDGGAEVVVGWWWLACRVAGGLARLEDGASVAVACALRWRVTAVVVAPRGSASARCRGVVANPTTLPPIAPMSTAAITELHRRDSTKRTGLKTGSPPDRASLTR
jgi:hypothetical protein